MARHLVRSDRDTHEGTKAFLGWHDNGLGDASGVRSFLGKILGLLVVLTPFAAVE